MLSKRRFFTLITLRASSGRGNERLTFQKEVLLSSILVKIANCFTKLFHTYMGTFFLERHFYERGPRDLTAKSVMVLSLVLQSIHFTPRRALRTQLSGVRDILRNHDLALGLEPGSHNIPKDPRTCISHFDLLPVIRVVLVHT